MTTNTISTSVAKLVVAVALTLAVMFTTGVSDNLLDTGFVQSASAGCLGGGNGGGGGC